MSSFSKALAECPPASAAGQCRASDRRFRHHAPSEINSRQKAWLLYFAKMPVKEWEIPLADGMFLLVSRLTVNGRVRKFGVVLHAEKDGRLRCLTRYDTAHGYPHQDILDQDENTLAKIIIPTDDLEEAFHYAINDLKTHAQRYLETFGQD